MAADLSQLRVAPFYQQKSVAAFSKALNRADGRVEPLDLASVWRAVFPDRDRDAEVRGDEFLGEQYRSRLAALGVRFLIILGSTATTTVTSTDFPGVHLLGKWDVSTTQELTLVDLAEAGSQDHLSARADGQSSATWVPASVLLFAAFVTKPDTRAGVLDANAGRVKALLAERVPEGRLPVVVVSEPGPDL